MKKMSIRSFVKVTVALLATLFVAGTLSACSLIQGASIDGEWTSPTMAKQVMDEAFSEMKSEEIFTNTDHKIEEVFTGSEVRLSVVDDKATLSMTITVDRAAFYKAMTEEYDAALKKELSSSGMNYDELDATAKAAVDANRPTEQDFYKIVDQAFESMASAMKGAYDSETGLVTVNIFTGDVNRTARTIDITKVNSVVAEDLVTDDESSISYTLKGKDTLTLDGGDEEDVVFELVK